MATFKNPREISQKISQQVKPFDYDPFLRDYNEQDMGVDYSKADVHYPSEYESGYKEREDINDQLSFYPTKNKDVFYLISNFMGDGFTTLDNVKKYIKGSYPYDKAQWEKDGY